MTATNTTAIKKPLTPAQQRNKDWKALCVELNKSKPAKAAPVTFCNSAKKDHYLGEDLTQAPVRPSADDSLRLPSRMGQRLHYRGGLVTCMAGTPIAPALEYAEA